jgi:hypothetical protein
MPFTTIPTSIIESGDPVTQELFSTYIKADLDDLDSRVTSLEAGSAVAYMPIYWNVKGPLKAKTDCGFVRIPFDITLLAVRLITQTAGSGGTTTIDFQYKRGAGSWTTVCGTKPSVTSTSDYTISTNGTLSVTAILSGDLIRMNIDTVQTGATATPPKGLIGIIEFSKT